jgi:hypothetical protein
MQPVWYQGAFSFRDFYAEIQFLLSMFCQQQWGGATQELSFSLELR